VDNIIKICPLLNDLCLEEKCAWWTGIECAIIKLGEKK